jgi:hypothetical protein
MGEDLGQLYSALWQSVSGTHKFWNEYVVLFGTSPERIDVLNQTAPGFFRMVQDEFWDSTMLHLARLTDAANSLGKKDRSNLTILALAELISDQTLKDALTKLAAEATSATQFCRDWRNRRIAHRDLKLALDKTSPPLSTASRRQVKDALLAISNVMNAVSLHYLDSQSGFHLVDSPHGASALVHVLEVALKARKSEDDEFE